MTIIVTKNREVIKTLLNRPGNYDKKIGTFRSPNELEGILEEHISLQNDTVEEILKNCKDNRGSTVLRDGTVIERIK